MVATVTKKYILHFLFKIYKVKLHEFWCGWLLRKLALRTTPITAITVSLVQLIKVNRMKNWTLVLLCNLRPGNLSKYDVVLCGAFTLRVYLLLTSSHSSSLLPGVKERRPTSFNYTFSSINWVDAFLGLPSKILRRCSGSIHWRQSCTRTDRYSITLCWLKPTACCEAFPVWPVSKFGFNSHLFPRFDLRLTSFTGSFYLQVLAKLHVNASGMHSE